MLITMPYGNEVLHASLDGSAEIDTLDIADVPEISDVDWAVREVLEHPIGLSTALREIVAPGETIAIIVSDSFRHTGSDQYLPPLIDYLSECGIPDTAISFFYATGTHRAPNPEEQARILGTTLYERFRGRTFVHNPDEPENLVFLGTTSRGTPVRVNKQAHEADRLIATGAIVFHYFAGFGGGRKAVVPGLAGRDTVSYTHARTLDPDADRIHPDVRIGEMDGNPVSEDMLEAARFQKVDFILNTVLNRQGRIAGVFGGELEVAHRAGCAFARRLFTVPITQQADLVIASSGNAKNFVQSHKALFNAFQALKPGGRIIFVARCEEGLGGEQFTKWLQLKTREAIIEGLRQRCEVNGQTALSTIEKAVFTIFVTEMSEISVALTGGIKALFLQDALDGYFRGLTVKENTLKVYLMPSASYTVPMLIRPE